MLCPVCSTVDLKIADRQGVEIDYCPQCRGVWLDRGELDKIIERSASHLRTAEVDDDDDDYRRTTNTSYPDSESRSYPYKEKRKRGFLSDIFDVFD
ncbi:MAG: zf-TFIIB domain-containing protein [Anaerolineae bacterium]|nr:zf-TFIIB domain-containing protein [Anaerolineae bacterium]